LPGGGFPAPACSARIRPNLPLPAVLGHEVSGVVEAVGCGVRDL